MIAGPPPLRPGLGAAPPPIIRWFAILALAFAAIGLLFASGGIIWLAWFGSTPPPPEFLLPRAWLAILAVPALVAAAGYVAAMYACWRRRPALRFWLVGVAGDLTLVFATVAVTGGANLASLFTLDSVFDWVKIALPGMMILLLDRALIEAPRRA